MTLRRAGLGVLLIVAIGGCSPPPADTTADNLPLTGQQIFVAKCAVCHQPDGGGVPGLYPPLSSSTRLAGHPEKLVRIMLLGMKGRQVRNGATYNGIMPSWRFDLTDAQIAGVLNHLIQTWQPDGQAVTDELVTAIRNQTASESLFPSPEEVDRQSP